MIGLAHSPFLGSGSWDPVAGALASRGEKVLRFDLTGAFARQAGFYDAAGAAAARQIESPLTLVVHSGAGALVPSILREAGGRIPAVLFVDALLPHPGRCWFDSAPRALAARLRAAARRDRAPPWPDWLPDGVLAAMLPDQGMRERLTAEAPAIAIAYLDEIAPDCAGWNDVCRFGYIQLSPAYDREAAQARGLGWPVAGVGGHHLATLTDPDLVADAIIAMAATVGA